MPAPLMEENFQPVIFPPTMLIDADPYETMKESSIFFQRKHKVEEDPSRIVLTNNYFHNNNNNGLS
jgi:hypothetical protein